MPLYNRGLFEIISAQTIWSGSSTDLRVILVDNNYSFNRDQNFVSELGAGAEITGSTGYTRQTLTGRTVSEDDANDRIVMLASDTAFGALTTGDTIGGAVIYRHSASNDAVNPLIGFINLVDTPTNGSTFTINWHDTDGVFYVESP